MVAIGGIWAVSSHASRLIRRRRTRVIHYRDIAYRVKDVSDSGGLATASRRSTADYLSLISDAGFTLFTAAPGAV
jgi:hypothetical protein